MTLEQRWELAKRRIHVLKVDLDNHHTQSDEVIYLIQDIKARLDLVLMENQEVPGPVNVIL